MTDLILALDTPDRDSAFRLLDLIGTVQWVKVGSVLFTREGPSIVRSLAARGHLVFLDLKWHDIPNTVANAVAAARDLGARMATVHALGGHEMMQAATDAAAGDMDIVGVTVLTSHTPASFSGATGRTADGIDLTEEAIRLSRNALTAGLSGVVCSPSEARAVRQVLGPAPLVVVPGIRRPGDAADDQQRTATPRQAVNAGASCLVVGRPVLRAEDPVAVWTEFVNAL